MRSLSDLFRNFVQLGYVTHDIDAASAFLESTMGAGPCVKSYASSLGRPAPARAGGPRSAFVVVDGVPADEWRIDVALVNAGPTNLEIIRPVDGAVGLYRDAVRPGGRPRCITSVSRWMTSMRRPPWSRPAAGAGSSSVTAARSGSATSTCEPSSATSWRSWSSGSQRRGGSRGSMPPPARPQAHESARNGSEGV